MLVKNCNFFDLLLAPTTVTQTITTTRTAPKGYNANRGNPPNQGYVPRSVPEEKGYSLSSNAAPQHQEYIPQNNTTSQVQESAPRDGIISQRQDYASRNNTTPQIQEFAARTSATFQNREYGPRYNASSRPLGEGNAQRASMSQPHQGGLPSNPKSNAHESLHFQDEDDAGLARHNSIPRKQIGTPASTQYSPPQPSSPPRAQTSQSRQQSAPKPLPSTPAAVSHGHTDRQMDYAPQPPSILNRSRPIPTSQAGLQDAQDVVDRAKTDTYDTDVVETVAPGQFRSQLFEFRGTALSLHCFSCRPRKRS